MCGINRIISGKISSLPNIMLKESTIFERYEKFEKFSTGPTPANPGPTLLIVVTAAVIVVSKPKLSSAVIAIEKNKIAI